MKEYIEKVLEDRNGNDVNESLSSRFNMLLMKNRMQKHRAENDKYKVFDEFFYIEPVPSGARKKVYIRAAIDVEKFIKGFMNNRFEGISIVNPAELLYYPCVTYDNREIYDSEGYICEEYCEKIKKIMPLVNDSNNRNKKTAYFDLIINDIREGYSLISLKKEHRKRMKNDDFTVDDCIDRGLIFDKGIPKTISTEYLLDLIIEGVVYIENAEVLNVNEMQQTRSLHCISTDWCFDSFSEEVRRIVESY